MECKVKDITIYYEERGSGRPFFTLHGWTGDHRGLLFDFEPFFEGRDNWRRIYFDLPGMGRTLGPAWLTHQDQVLEVVLDFIDALAPGERFALAGVSYGGLLARGVVQRRSAQMLGVFLFVPVITAKHAQRNVPLHKVIVEDAGFQAALLPEDKDLQDLLVVQSVETYEKFKIAIKPAIDMADQAFLEKLSENYGFSFDVDKLAEPFPAPALILTGRQDSICGYAEAYGILENYPRATYAVLDRAGHGLGWEQPALYRALFTEWLDRVDEYSK